MAKIFISFLGTNQYLHCRYIINNSTSESVRYVQEALAQHYCNNWNKSDKFVVFATKGEFGSIETNWEKGKISSWDENGQKYEKEPLGLKDRLKNLNLNCKIDMKEIPDGTQEGEIWKIIKIINEQINEKDELYFDITHSFRYIPMIVPAIISFLKTTKNITLNSIHYGAFETLGSNQDVCKMKLEDRKAPIRELTELYQMIEWSGAVNSFVRYGDEKCLKDRIQSIDNSTIGKKLKGQLKTTQENITKLGIALRFNDISQLNKIKEVEISKKINLDTNPELLALKEISTKVEEHLSIWSKDEIKNGFLASKWCLNNDRFAQALTFAQESAIGYFYRVFDWDKDKSIDKKDKRGVVTFLLRLKKGDINIETQKPYIIDDFRSNNKLLSDWFKKSVDDSLKKIERDNELLEYFFDLEEWRNMVNHTKRGDRKNMQNRFPKVLDKFLEKIV